MTALRPDAFHFLTRAILMLAGALLLWAAPVSIPGLLLMLVGLVCAVSAFTLEKTHILEKTQQFWSAGGLPPINFVAVFIAFAALLLSLTIHEAAHALTADRLGDPTARLLGRVSLNPAVHIDPIGTILFPLIAMFTNVPLLGWAKPVPVNVTRLGAHWKRKYMLIAAAGPASNLVLAVAASALLHVVPVSGGLQTSLLTPLAVFLYRMVGLNIVLAIFNMIPVPPLDGGNVLSGVLRGPVADMYDGLRPYGFLILYALMFTGVLGRIVFPAADAVEAWLL